MIEAIQDIVATEPDTEIPKVAAQPDDAATETRLTQEINELWTEHTRLSADRKTTAKEIRQVRARLAESLHQMKSLLSRPGRGGLWRSWLRERGIPRSTADGLVARYAETSSAGDGNVPSRAISEPPKDAAEKLAKVVWSRFGKVLSSGESLVRFIGGIVAISGVPHEWREDGLMILHPVFNAASEVPSSVLSAQPVPLPSGEAPVTTQESTEEAAASAGSGEVL